MKKILLAIGLLAATVFALDVQNTPDYYPVGTPAQSDKVLTSTTDGWGNHHYNGPTIQSLMQASNPTTQRVLSRLEAGSLAVDTNATVGENLKVSGIDSVSKTLVVTGQT